jgi:hypothetical protein
MAAVIVVGIGVFPPPAIAQQGQDAVYSVSGQITNSPAFIDASQFAFKVQNPDFCSVLNYVFLNIAVPPTYPSGAVIDTRAVPNTTPPTSMTCKASPWAGITSPPPFTILLPAGTIQIPGTWILPSNTRLVGEGENNPLSATPGTTIQAVIGFSGSMIQFGSSSICGSSPMICSGISVERLTLDGQAQAVHGIVNQYSQNNTRVDQVTIYQIRGTGLLISDTAASSASNSGGLAHSLWFELTGWVTVKAAAPLVAV